MLPLTQRCAMFPKLQEPESLNGEGFIASDLATGLRIASAATPILPLEHQ